MYGFDRSSFREAAHGGDFINRNTEGRFMSPLTVMTKVALKRVVDGAELKLPDGYTPDVLENVYYMSGYASKDFALSGRLAAEMLVVGRGILDLNEQGLIQPPLSAEEGQSINHFIDLVSTVEARYALKEV